MVSLMSSLPGELLMPWSRTLSPLQIKQCSGSLLMKSVCVHETTISSKFPILSKKEKIPLLGAEEVLSKLKENIHAGASSYKAMYSSLTGGITKDPKAMIIPLDDHMVHRGHSVFDTASIWNGHLYELDPHLDRLLRSAKHSLIEPPFPREELRSILIQTVAVSGVKFGTLRYYLSAGTGGFNLSMAECVGSTFYAVVIEEEDRVDSKGVKVITSSIPIKPPQFATIKSTNYLPNALVMAEASKEGAYTGIWLDQEGFIGEGPSMNVAFVTADRVLLVPSFEKVLSGCTAKRMLELAQSLIEEGTELIKEIRVAPVTVEEARAANEMFLVGSGILIKSIVQWDNRPVGDGSPGPVASMLRELLKKDRSNPPIPQQVVVEYPLI